MPLDQPGDSNERSTLPSGDAQPRLCFASGRRRLAGHRLAVQVMLQHSWLEHVAMSRQLQALHGFAELLEDLRTPSASEPRLHRRDHVSSATALLCPRLCVGWLPLVAHLFQPLLLCRAQAVGPKLLLGGRVAGADADERQEEYFCLFCKARARRVPSGRRFPGLSGLYIFSCANGQTKQFTPRSSQIRDGRLFMFEPWLIHVLKMTRRLVGGSGRGSVAGVLSSEVSEAQRSNQVFQHSNSFEASKPLEKDPLQYHSNVSNCTEGHLGANWSHMWHIKAPPGMRELTPHRIFSRVFYRS
mmetsp:Transcript_26600/g.65816  ORF Transcript_26600/g.65816 Transcript_26600/m.65816 type:complete len:300 (+) Transcript_26600:250-1149(+)